MNKTVTSSHILALFFFLDLSAQVIDLNAYDLSHCVFDERGWCKINLTGDEAHCGMINTRGEIVLPCKYNHFSYILYQGKTRFLVQESGEYYYDLLNEDLQKLSEGAYNLALSTSERSKAAIPPHYSSCMSNVPL